MTGTYNPNISVDCVVFGFDTAGLKVLLVEREVGLSGQGGKLMHDLKLPGSLVYNDELLDDAAKRVLKELTGLEKIFLEQFDVLDSLDRMKNRMDREWLELTTGLAIDRVVSIAYYGLVNLSEDKPLALSINAKWVPVGSAKKLPFDHSQIIDRARNLLLHRVTTDSVVFDLLPKKFSILRIQQIFETFSGKKLDSRNFRKKIKSFTFIVPLEEKQLHVAHKPARLYKFDKKKFVQYKNAKSISIL
jgi:hypothetical protein